LQAYRDGTRADPLEMMNEVAKRMTDEEMDAVAAYVERLNGPAPPAR
jgi:cytochrome c553